MSTINYLTLRNSVLTTVTSAVGNYSTLTGSSIIVLSTITTPTLVYSTLRGSTINTTQVNVSTINTTQVNVSSITTSMVQYADNSQIISAGTTLDYTTFALNLATTAATTQTTYNGYAMSATGQYHTACYGAASGSGGVYYSNNYGTTWNTATISPGASTFLIGVGMSASGQYQVLGVNGAGGQIFVSSNYGVTWAVVASSYTGLWHEFCVSASGQYMTGVLYYYGPSGFTSAIYYSTNYGSSWTIATGYSSTTILWMSVCCSSSGQYQTASSNGSGVWYSSNYGATWTLASGTSSGVWISVRCSASGQYQTTAVYGGGSIYISSNYGVTWTIISSTVQTNWNGVGMSASGQYQVAGVATGTVYYSNNYGATWTTTGAPSLVWGSLAVSQTGQYVGGIGGNYVYLSVTRNPAMFSSGNVVTSGNVGIGTTAPSTNLHVYGSSTGYTSGIVTITNNNANPQATMNILAPSMSTTNNLLFNLGQSLSSYNSFGILFNYVGSGYQTNYLLLSAYGNGNGLTVQGSGNVGIGITNPSSKLHVIGSNSIGTPAVVSFINNGTGQNTSGSDTVFSQITLGPYGPYIRCVQSNNFYTDGIRLDLCTNAGSNDTTPVPRISMLSGISGSYVGIGTTSPVNLLNLQGTGGLTNMIAFNNYGNAVPYVGCGYDQTNDGFTIMVNQSSTFLNTGVVMVKRSGNVGIGTTSPGYPLHVIGNINVTGSILYNGTAITTGTGSIWTAGSGGVAYYSGGNVGIGTATPLARFTIRNRYDEGDTSGLCIDSYDGNTYNLRLSSFTPAAAQVNYKFSVNNIALSSPNALVLAYNGRIGIGTATPNDCLHVYQATSANWSGRILAGGGANVFVAGEYNGVVNCGGHNFALTSWANVVSGSAWTFTSSISKASGTFDIDHPLYPSTDKRLVHSFIEGPRCDLIYRGKTTLVNGSAVVDINKECTHSPECAMEDGTFEALCANPQIFLQNNQSFDRVIGSVTGATLTITCENSSATTVIEWMVIAERIDPFIKKWDRTNSDGFLITQYSKPHVPDPFSNGM